METPLILLVLANFAFVALHFLMSHPLRVPMVSLLGEMGFQIVYSAVIIATLAGVYFAFIQSPEADLSGTGQVGWAIASVITIPAMVLFTGSLIGNPAMASPGAEKNARAAPKGVFTITRHPMMWSFALWALAHIALHWSWRTTITATAVGVLALVGSRLQDGKKRELMGEAWMQWEANTSFWPKLRGFAKAGALPWSAGLILFVFLTWLHMPIGGIPAGIWRWF
ncbi:MAG: NnrU family protein [Erythrobacter sp.]|uniref:NnrU family protein n=1 Tax=Erythrobacter sp. TaxID=1042 RepID=UPI00329981E4